MVRVRMILIYIHFGIRYKPPMDISRHLDFDRLPATERLVLITLRARVDGCRGSSVDTLYRMACGLAWVERAMASFDALVQTLAGGARRPLAISALADGCVSCDEQCLLALLAAHQLGLPGDAEARARWLVRHESVAALEEHAGAFARVLVRCGRQLSPDWLQPPTRALRAPAPIPQGARQQFL